MVSLESGTPAQTLSRYGVPLLKPNMRGIDDKVQGGRRVSETERSGAILEA